MIVTRSSNNFGPYQYPEKVIPLFITNALEDKPLPLYGDGKNVRDWLYVLDNCAALDLILRKGKDGEIYNIGGQPRSRERAPDPAGSSPARQAGEPHHPGGGSAGTRPPLRSRLEQGGRARLEARRIPSGRPRGDRGVVPGLTRRGGSRSSPAPSAPTTRSSTPRASHAPRRPSRRRRSCSRCPRSSRPLRSPARPGSIRKPSRPCLPTSSTWRPPSWAFTCEVPSDRPSAATLGAERWGSGVLFDAAGYALTVSYVLIDAARVDVVLRDGRKVEGKVAGLDLESGLGVIKLEGRDRGRPPRSGTPRDWRWGTSRARWAWMRTAPSSPRRARSVHPRLRRVVGVHARPRALRGPVQSRVRRAALVDQTGAVVGITSLRLGEATYMNLAIPIEQFLGGPGRADRQGPRGEPEAAAVAGTLHARNRRRAGGGGRVPIGPARSAGFRPGDRDRPGRTARRSRARRTSTGACGGDRPGRRCSSWSCGPRASKRSPCAPWTVTASSSPKTSRANLRCVE